MPDPMDEQSVWYIVSWTPEHKQQERTAFNWCGTHIGMYWIWWFRSYNTDALEWHFAREEDMIQFKLTWCD